ncbi:heme A synthase [Brevibacillus agri]|uniref:Heme A synthase n=1 Tax=Brevibacillus agri TaxID=51101 RepID=A0A3M8AJ31_9BACL|nr:MULTISPECIES: heme A synthase [Brevibacillus]MBG9565352.1 cytochrome aa3 oxidase assembly protein [Brevibacillus agri]MBY0050919.1 heme A synthase [Brevibacillus agri]MCG5252820.1 heme A synthase [Brevibacillus agri]MDN4092733.1 heme A synthase [Brevibacillus agri]MED1645616.1 heme A synthase [Brevibacillus agri]
MEKWLKPLAVLATLVMFIVMIAGSLVTKTDSGLGCGNDWPLCNGKWVPEYTLASIIEYMHRLITGVAGIVVVVFSVLCWRHYRGNQEVRNLALFGLFFIVLESILGASAVIWPQSSSVLALHFGFSLLAFTGVFLLTGFVLQRDKMESMVQDTASTGFRNWMWAVAAYTYGVVYLGAYVRHTGSSMACSDWPLCQGQLIPQLSGQTGIHFAHRLGALLLVFLLLGTMIYAMRHFKEKRRDLYGASILAFVLVILQVFSGGFVVLFQLHLYATLLHSMIITILFGVISYMCLQSHKSPQAGKLRR